MKSGGKACKGTTSGGKKIIQHGSALLSVWKNVLASLVCVFVPVVEFIKIEYNCF